MGRTVFDLQKASWLVSRFSPPNLLVLKGSGHEWHQFMQCSLFLSSFFHPVLVKFSHEFVRSSNPFFLMAECVAVFLFRLVASPLPVDVCLFVVLGFYSQCRVLVYAWCVCAPSELPALNHMILRSATSPWHPCWIPLQLEELHGAGSASALLPLLSPGGVCLTSS